MMRIAVAGVLLVSGACTHGPGPNPPPPPPFPSNESKCSVAKSQSEPLVVEWPSASRAKLEALTKKGVVVVAYQGCEMRVLAHCKAPGAYAFTPTTREREVVTIHDADELYANVPVGAAKLEGKLQSSGQLSVSMTIVGRYETSTPFVATSDLHGACDGATHVVAGLTTGSFKFFAGADAEVGAEAEALVASAGAKSVSKSELLNEDGDEVACAKSSSSAAAPPDGCGAILRVEVVPLGAAKAKAPTCPAGTSWDGAQCVASAVQCPSGSKWNGAACVGAAPLVATAPAATAATITPSAPKSPACPPGKYLQGSQCVASSEGFECHAYVYKSEPRTTQCRPTLADCTSKFDARQKDTATYSGLEPCAHRATAACYRIGWLKSTSGSLVELLCSASMDECQRSRTDLSKSHLVTACVQAGSWAEADAALPRFE